MVYLAHGSFWLYLNFFVVNILALVLSVTFAHMLTKEVYGSYQFILAIGAVIGALTLSGMNNAVTRAVAQGDEGTVLSSIPVQLRYDFIASVTAFSIATYYALEGNVTLALGMAAIGLFVPLTNTFNTHIALLNGRKNFKGVFLFTSLPAALYAGTMFGALFFVKNPAGLVFVNLGTNALLMCVFFFVAIRHYKPNVHTSSTSITYGKHLSVANIISSAAAQFDALLVFHLLGPVSLAIYSFASTVPEKFGGLLKGFNVLALPKFSKRSALELQKTLQGKVLRFFLFYVAIAFAYSLAAPFIFSLLFRQYMDSVLYSQGYAFALAFGSLASIPLTALVATKAQKQIYLFNTTSSLISIAFMIVLTVIYGIWGLIAARAITGIINYILVMQLFPNQEVIL
ncbi:MAG TPA: oligosaccharide flippase family protein [Candidatus Paceibacterota bacterium]